MKRIITSIFSIMLCLLSAFAQSDEQVTLVLNIDDIDHVSVDLFGEEVSDLKSGTNTLSVSPWTSVGINAKDGYILTSVANAAGEAQPITNQKNCSVFIGDQNETITITTEKVSNINFTIIVDDASLVTISDAQWKSVTVSDGSNQLSLGATQLPLGITSTKRQPFYKVTLDDEEIPYNWGYSVTPREGSVINIQTKYPDVDFNVTFDYVDEANNDFFCAVCVDDKPVDFANGFSAKAGSKIALFYNTGLWYNTQEDPEFPLTVKLNGEEIQWFGPGNSFILSKDTEVQVAAASRKSTITVYLTVDNKDGVIVYRGSESNRDVVAMQPGKNAITIGEDDARIVIETANDDFKILNASVNDDDVYIDYDNYLELSSLKEGDSIFVGTNAQISAINEISAQNESVTIYSISGVRILDNASPVSFKNLPAGIYIVNGKKVLVK